MRVSLFLLSLFAALQIVGCASPPDTGVPTVASAAPEYVPEATVKDLMQSVVDTSADVVWLSVTLEVSNEGTSRQSPGTTRNGTRPVRVRSLLPKPRTSW
jgi:hypothetical protein